MTVEEFELKQSKMSDSELINLCQKEVGELASTYGKSHRMTIPPMVTDTDMLLSELIKRFKMLSEAIRWRDPKEELPNEGEEVQLKIFDTYHNQQEYTHDVYLGGRWRLCESKYIDVLGWRPIK